MSVNINRMCCQNMGLYPKDCAATIQLFTLQTMLPIYPPECASNIWVFTLQIVLSIRDSLPYTVCCHNTGFTLETILPYTGLYPSNCAANIALYPTCSTVIARLFTLQNFVANTTLYPADCAVITRLFTLRSVLSLHDSLP